MRATGRDPQLGWRFAKLTELATHDLTSYEVAQVLFITAGTADGHVASVFRRPQLDSHSAPTCIADSPCGSDGAYILIGLIGYYRCDHF